MALKIRIHFDNSEVKKAWREAQKLKDEEYKQIKNVMKELRRRLKEIDKDARVFLKSRSVRKATYHVEINGKKFDLIFDRYGVLIIEWGKWPEGNRSLRWNEITVDNLFSALFNPSEGKGGGLSGQIRDKICSRWGGKSRTFENL